MAAGKSGIIRYTFGGKEKVAAYTPAQVFPGRIWAVQVNVPIEDVRTALLGVGVEPIFLRFSIIMAAVILLSEIIVLIYLILTVFSPIAEITTLLEKTSQGDMTQSLKIKEGKDEIGRLAAAFNRILTSLKLAMKETGKEGDK